MALEFSTQGLIDHLREMGFRGRAVSISHLPELEEEMQRLRREGLVDEGVYGDYLSSFDFTLPQDLPKVKSILVVAAPQSQYRVTFQFDKEPVQRDEDAWREARILEACQNCTACQNRCPTGAIASDRFQVHAERCLTYWNEKPAEDPFPEWIDPQWHTCMVGCMVCQNVCPENRAFWNWIEEGPVFSRGETASLLVGASADRLPTGVKEKVEGFDLPQLLYTLPRNLEIYA